MDAPGLRPAFPSMIVPMPPIFIRKKEEKKIEQNRRRGEQAEKRARTGESESHGVVPYACVCVCVCHRVVMHAAKLDASTRNPSEGFKSNSPSPRCSRGAA